VGELGDEAASPVALGLQRDAHALGRGDELAQLSVPTRESGCERAQTAFRLPRLADDPLVERRASVEALELPDRAFDRRGPSTTASWSVDRVTYSACKRELSLGDVERRSRRDEAPARGRALSLDARPIAMQGVDARGRARDRRVGRRGSAAFRASALPACGPRFAAALRAARASRVNRRPLAGAAPPQVTSVTTASTRCESRARLRTKRETLTKKP
jgi:hypothetical protein